MGDGQMLSFTRIQSWLSPRQLLQLYCGQESGDPVAQTGSPKSAFLTGVQMALQRWCLAQCRKNSQQRRGFLL